MKKILFPILLIALLFTACEGNTSSIEEPVVDEAATAVAEVLYATQTAIAAENTAAEVLEVAEEVSAALNTDYTDAAPVYTQLIVGLLMMKDTGLAVTADQASSLLSILSSLATMTPENVLSEESVTQMIDQAIDVLSVEQIQAISDMQITQESAMTAMQDLGLGMGGKDGQTAGEGGPGGGEPPSGTPGEGGPGGGGGAPGNPGEGDAADGEAPSADQEMDRGIMIQPQLIQALIEYLQRVSV